MHHDGKAATCTEAGWEAYDDCTNCTYTTYQAINALGHAIVHHDAQAPTCTDVGWDAYDTCSRCDYTTYVEIPATGHTPADPVEENRVEPQVGVDGSYDEVVYCATCQAELDRVTKAIKALDADPDAEPVVVNVPDDFTQFCLSLAERIRRAAKNGTVEADCSMWEGLKGDVFAALQDRSDVTLKITYLAKGEKTELEIPAGKGADLVKALGDKALLTWEEIAKVVK